MKLLVTGGAGFIGSNFVRLALRRWPRCRVVVLDALTYAGNRASLDDVAGNARFTFIHGDICDPDAVRQALAGCTHVVNFAAETHVDRSILDASAFVRTDVEGTRVLLEAIRQSPRIARFLQVSTDEVYGAIDAPHRASEDHPLRPSSPYAASKAAGDLLALAYHATYAVPVLITRGVNTYGPYQFPEKLIPLFITNALDGRPLPLYGDGRQLRVWLHVDDHCAALAVVLQSGAPGQIYNVGAGSELPNHGIAEHIVALTGCKPKLIKYVADRPGHDRRYAVHTAKLRTLGWKARIPFADGLEATVRWYVEHRAWWESLRDEKFDEYYRQQYTGRLASAHR